jgi:hypothetical protein
VTIFIWIQLRRGSLQASNQRRNIQKWTYSAP